MWPIHLDLNSGELIRVGLYLIAGLTAYFRTIAKLDKGIDALHRILVTHSVRLDHLEKQVDQAERSLYELHRHPEAHS